MKSLFCFALCLVLTITAQSAEKWTMHEIAFEAPEEIPVDPFSAELSAVFRHETGREMHLPGFFDGQSWRLRFSPPLEGGWSYVTTSSIPALSGQRGSVEVGPAPGEARGPIRISSENPQAFAYADGSPYPLLAFECDWLFALDADDAEGIPRTEKMVETIRESGFNQVVLNVFAYDAGFGEKDKILPEHDFSKPAAFPFGGSNENPDHSTLNLEFFDRFDRVLSHLNEQGIVAHLMIYVWNKKVNWPEPASADDDRYFDYVVKRFGAYPNLIWNISKEALDYGHVGSDYVVERIDRLQRLNGHERLLSVHDYQFCERHPDLVDFVAIQEWNAYLVDRLVAVRNAHADKPVFVIEHGGYEKSMASIFDGAYNRWEDCLDRSWQCLFAGTYPTYYWQNAAWYHVVYDLETIPADQRPKLAPYRHMQEFMQDFPAPDFEPMPLAFAPPILANEAAGIYLFYVPENRRGIFCRIEALDGKRGSVEWRNLLTGEIHDDGHRDIKDRGWISLHRPKELSSPTAVAVLRIDDGE